MCDATTIALVAVSAGSSVYEGQQLARIDKINRNLAEAEAEIRNANLKEERKIAQINAKEEENFRRQQVERNISSMRALNRGLDSNSFLNLVDYEKQAFEKDLGNIRLGLRVETSRIANEISVNKVASTLPDLSGHYKTAGMIKAASTIAEGVRDYKSTEIPPKKKESSYPYTTKASIGRN